MIHVGIAIAILMGSLLLGVSIPFAFGAGTIYMYTMLGGTFASTLPVGFNGINTMVLLAIPTFIMAGGFIEKGKVGDELVSVVEMLLIVCIVSYNCSKDNASFSKRDWSSDVCSSDLPMHLPSLALFAALPLPLAAASAPSWLLS